MKIVRFSKIIITLVSGMLLGAAGCVTQTERLPYHRGQLPEEEGVLDELKRELGWHASDEGSFYRRANEEPFYKRAARSVKKTVSGWLKDDDEPQPGLPARLTEDERQQAGQDLRSVMQRLQELQAQDQREAVRRLEEQRQREGGEQQQGK